MSSAASAAPRAACRAAWAERAAGPRWGSAVTCPASRLQVGGVGAGPVGGGAVGGPCPAGGRHALLGGGSGGTGATAQVAALGGLAAGDTERAGEIGPTGARAAGGFDQPGLPAREMLTHLPQQEQGGQCLFGPGAHGVGGPALRVAQRVAHGGKGCRGGDEGRRAAGPGTGRGRLVRRVHGHLPRRVSSWMTSGLSSIGRQGATGRGR